MKGTDVTFRNVAPPDEGWEVTLLSGKHYEYRNGAFREDRDPYALPLEVRTLSGGMAHSRRAIHAAFEHMWRDVGVYRLLDRLARLLERPSH